LAALWVVLFHIRAFSGAHLWPGLDLFVRSGSTGVSLFLVLSGFCLYLPVTGGRAARFRTGTFFRRRVRRLLPAYFASLAVLAACQLAFGGHAGLPRMTTHQFLAQVLTHATLTHQFFPNTFYGFNGAYWSLGLEWELYLTLPVLVLAVRRFGLGRTVGGVFAVTIAYRLALFAAIAEGLFRPGGVLATVVLPNVFLGRWSEFGLGMVAAELYRRGHVSGWPRRAWLPAVLLAGVAVVIRGNPLSHVLFGGVFFVLLCTVLAGDNWIARALAWRPLVAIGAMSYSLYLVHQPLVEVSAALLGARAGTAPSTVLVELLLLVPVYLLAAWLLFMLVERRSVDAASLEAVPWGRRTWLRPRRRLAPSVPAPRSADPTVSADRAAGASVGASTAPEMTQP
jgi:peptidoglycan/LPS O-acetylase OafA/YrhL